MKEFTGSIFEEKLIGTWHNKMTLTTYLSQEIFMTMCAICLLSTHLVAILMNSGYASISGYGYLILLIANYSWKRARSTEERRAPMQIMLVHSYIKPCKLEDNHDLR